MLSQESSRKDNWMPLNDLVSNLDIYNGTHNDDHKPCNVIAAVGGSSDGFKPNAN